MGTEEARASKWDARHATRQGVRAYKSGLVSKSCCASSTASRKCSGKRAWARLKVGVGVRGEVRVGV